ncbi:IS1634 family transposase [Mycoplasmopsis verecunda]|uniref:IS1634 family transposase n=1 Tax=Mycoplasmopsis verecunda TaxID=171291 RepID=UPI00298D1B3F|nr:IS1634 family transposase [Mycoplasmopsis verecunda]WPB54832.1 IS1634 family transposase [Mycoplasmopsis verecunda]
MESKFIVIKHKRKDHTYISIATSNGYGKGYSNQIGLGRLEKLQELNSESINVIKNSIKNLSISESKDKIKQAIMFDLNSSKSETYNINYGINLLYDLIDKFEIFSALPKTRHKDLNRLLKYTVSSRILNADSLISTYKNKFQYENTPDYKKSSYYTLLDILNNNESKILKQLNEKITKNTSRNIELVFYDSSTAYFESFRRTGLRYPGYSKDGKFKENQVVIGLATDENGIPIHYKLFKGNTTDSKTFIPFVIEMSKIYNIKNVTIVADKGMSVTANLRFLEQKGIDYVISYRLKSGRKDFKEYVLNETDYIGTEEFKYKEQTVASLYNKRDLMVIREEKIITYSRKLALKDKADRDILINNFNKLKNKDGYVEGSKLLGHKKYRFFKRNGDARYELDLIKLNEDKQFDGFYIYETSRRDLSAQEIVEIYAKQLQIEENFRTLKNSLEVKPMYVWTDAHINGHFLLCFISLVIFKYLLYTINKSLNDYGVIDKFTNKRTIEAIKSAQKFVKVVDGNVVDEIYIKNSENNSLIQDFELIKTIFNKFVQVI